MSAAPKVGDRVRVYLTHPWAPAFRVRSVDRKPPTHKQGAHYAPAEGDGGVVVPDVTLNAAVSAALQIGDYVLIEKAEFPEFDGQVQRVVRVDGTQIAALDDREPPDSCLVWTWQLEGSGWSRRLEVVEP